MANELTVKVTADSRAAVSDFKRLTDQMHAMEMAARRAGSGMQAFGNAAEHSLGRVAARAAQARREIEQMRRVEASPFGAATGRGFSRSPGFSLTGAGAAGVGIAAGAAALSYASTAYSEYRSQAQAETYLANAARQTGQAYAAQADEVAKLRRELGLTTAQALELRAATLKFTGIIGKPGEANKLATSLANALAASGRSTSEIPDRLRQLSTGQDELFDVLGPVKIGSTFAGSPETIYKAYAREILNVNRELTDLEKTQARYYAVLQAGAAAEGAAAERMATSAGRIEVLTNRWSDLAGAIGRAVLESRTAKGILAGGELLANRPETKEQGIQYQGLMDEFLGSVLPLLPGVSPAMGRDIEGYYSRQRLLRQMVSQGRGALTSLRRDGPGAAVSNLLDFFGIEAGGGLYRPSLSAPYTGVLNTHVDAPYDPFARPEMAENRKAYRAYRDMMRGRIPQLVGAASGNFSEYFQLGSRLNELRAAGGGTLETTEQQIARYFGMSEKYSDVALATYRAAGVFPDAEARAQADAQSFLVRGLAGVDVGALTADQRAAYESALLAAQQNQLKQAAETLATAIKMEKHLKALADRLAPEDRDQEPPTVIQIDNRSDTVARFAALAQGDALRSDQ